MQFGDLLSVRSSGQLEGINPSNALEARSIERELDAGACPALENCKVSLLHVRRQPPGVKTNLMSK